MESSSSSWQLAPQVVPLGDDPLSAFIQHRPSLNHEEEEQHQYTNNSYVEMRKTNILCQNNINASSSSSSSSSSRWSEFYNTHELINLIYMDIHRLPCDHSSSSSSSRYNNNKKERGENIVHILYLYAKLYPTIGYRQGMHGIVSYIF
jgi:hypothetical protein